MQQLRGEGSTWIRLALVIAAGLFGLVGLAAVFSALPGPQLSLIWLALALADALVLLFPMPQLARALAALFDRLAARVGHQRAWTQRAEIELARVLIAAAYLVLAESILRRPLVAVFGADVEPFLVEAAFGAFAFLVLLALFGWAYSVARPLLEDVAWYALDSAFVTVQSASQVTVGDGVGPELEHTVIAPQRRTAIEAATVPVGSEPTLVAGTPRDAERPPVAAEPTVIASEATEVAPARPESAADETVVSSTRRPGRGDLPSDQTQLRR